MQVLISEQQLRLIIKEQTGMGGGDYAAKYLIEQEDTQTVEYPAPWGGNFAIPADSYDVKLWDANDSRLGYFIDRVDGKYTTDRNGQYLIKGRLAPSEAYMQSILPSGTLRRFTTRSDNFKWFLILKFADNGLIPNKDYFREDPKNPNKYIAFNPSTYIHTSTWTSVKNWFAEHWVDIAIIVGAVLVGGIAGAIYAGTVGSTVAGAEAFNLLGWSMTNQAFVAYLGEAAVWSGSAAYNFSKGNNGSGAIDLFFGIVLPALHGVGIAKWGIRATDEVIESTAAKVVGKTPQELEALMTKPAAEGGLSTAEKQFVQDASSLPKQSVTQMTNELTAKANANIKAKGTNITKNPTLARVKNIVETSKVGAYLKEKWYRWLPTMFAHDMVFIHLVQSISKKFGIVDKMTIEKMAKAAANAKTEPEKTKFYQDAKTIVEKSGSLDELKKNTDDYLERTYVSKSGNKMNSDDEMKRQMDSLMNNTPNNNQQ